MSLDPRKSIAYVLTKPVKRYMDTDVLLLDQYTSTRKAARILRHYERDDIIVTDENKKPIGIVTDEDILSKVGDVTVNAETTLLKDIMTTPLITVDENASLQDALHKMRDHHIRKLPVVSKKDEVLGIILQATVAHIIRNSTAVQPRLFSPPIKAIIGNLGFVLQFAGVLLLVPAILATALNDVVTATGIYLTTVLLLVTGFFLNAYGEKASLNLRQASILVFSTFFILSLFGTIPYLYVLPFNTESPVEIFANSFFSSAAGFTTGGISLFDKPEELPQSFTFFRSYTQLIGGMSFIYLVITAFYPESKLQAMRGFISGKTLHLRELFSTITVIFALYIVIVALLLYVFGERNIIDNFSLAMSTLSTGGFVPSSTILQDLLWQEYLILIAGMILGALPFTFHYTFVKRKFIPSKLGTEVLVFFAILGGALALFVLLSDFDPMTAMFLTVSASTTAGLQPESLAGESPWAQTILIILMLVGGCGFSTAGGIKVFRFLHLQSVKKALNSQTRKTLTIETKKDIATSIIVLILFPLIASLTAFHFISTTDTDFGDAFLDATAVITTGGLTADVITINYDAATKMGLSMLMIIGRLEIIAIVYIFVPRLST